MNARPAILDTAIDGWTRQLLSDGYCIVPELVERATVETLDRDLERDFAETPFCRGGFYGERTKRFGRLLIRSPIARELITHELVLGVVRRVLSPWCDTVQLNLTQALALHSGAPPQLPHRDQDMWRGAIGEIEYLVNVMWPFTRYTAENGATRIWPNSHGPRALDAEPTSAEFAAELEPGSALLFLGSTLHGAGGNRSNTIRRGAIVSYCLGWLKPYENQWLAYPPSVARGFDRGLAHLVGYAQHRPNLGNFEGQCPSLLLEREVPERIGAADALRPDQEELVERFVEDQAWPFRGITETQ
jgi:ectoine hydroxylase-related dioxygenase (phytanoyl-CoA dioxygenase family)